MKVHFGYLSRNCPNFLATWLWNPWVTWSSLPSCSWSATTTLSPPCPQHYNCHHHRYLDCNIKYNQCFKWAGMHQYEVPVLLSFRFYCTWTSHEPIVRTLFCFISYFRFVILILLRLRCITQCVLVCSTHLFLAGCVKKKNEEWKM